MVIILQCKATVLSILHNLSHFFASFRCFLTLLTIFDFAIILYSHPLTYIPIYIMNTYDDLILDFDSDLSLDDFMNAAEQVVVDDAVPSYEPVFVSTNNDSPLLAFLRSSKLQNSSQHTSTTGCLTYSSNAPLSTTSNALPSSSYGAYADVTDSDDEDDDDDMSVESMTLEYLQSVLSDDQDEELQSSASTIVFSSSAAVHHKTLSLADEIDNCHDEEFMVSLNGDDSVGSLQQVSKRLNQCMDRSAQSRNLIHSLSRENSSHSLATNGHDSSSSLPARRSEAAFKPSLNERWSTMPSMKNTTGYLKKSMAKHSLHGTENASWERSGMMQ
jgi:hypothetical protein